MKSPPPPEPTSSWLQGFGVGQAQGCSSSACQVTSPRFGGSSEWRNEVPGHRVRSPAGCAAAGRDSRGTPAGALPALPLPASVAFQESAILAAAQLVLPLAFHSGSSQHPAEASALGRCSAEGGGGQAPPPRACLCHLPGWGALAKGGRHRHRGAAHVAAKAQRQRGVDSPREASWAASPSISTEPSRASCPPVTPPPPWARGGLARKRAE